MAVKKADKQLIVDNVRTKRNPVKVAKAVNKRIPVAPVIEVAPVVDLIDTTQNCVNVEYQPVEPVINKPKLTAVVSPEPVKQSHKGRGVMVGVAGAGLAGYLTFTGVKTTLLDKGYSEDDSKQYASISGGVIGLITFVILYNLLKKN